VTPASLVVKTRTERDTERLGERVGRLLAGGEFLGLTGDLGAGKTAFVRGLARGAGVPADAAVSSPTFALVNVYRGGRITVLHADLYRVRDAEELYDAGFYDLADGALVVEWIDRVPDAAPADRLDVRIEKRPGGRTFAFEAHGDKAASLLQRLAADGARPARPSSNRPMRG
jgi:tRNA threonylcarbamoyladenosine biosynthesis protein TsaE